MIKPFFLYLKWHYFIAPRDFSRNWLYFVSLVLHYFSIPLLIRTLFEPWRRYIEEYPRGLDIQIYAIIFVRNLISRIIGAIVRVVVICLGLIFVFCAFVGGFFVFIIWLFLPILALASLIIGFVMIIVYI